MVSTLDRLLSSIDPQRTLEETSRRADRAVNSFRISSGRVDRWEEFRGTLTAFLRHVEFQVCKMNGWPYVDEGADFDWRRCSQLLRLDYGAEGYKAAFELARTGNEGGLYGVLRRLARRIAEHYAENEVRGRISNWWNSLSLDEKFAALDEYLEKYGHLLPSELTEDSAARLKASFPKVLEEHSRMIGRLRRVGR